jgi:hypothetical protein
MEDARDMQGADDANFPDAEPGRSAPERRDRNFVEINRWSHDDHSKEQIDEFAISSISTILLVSDHILERIKITIRHTVYFRIIELGTPRKEQLPTLCCNVLWLIGVNASVK